MVEDNKQLILEGQLHVALQTMGKEASSLTPKEVSEELWLEDCSPPLQQRLSLTVSVLQEAQEMVLLKFKSELPPPVVLPSAELSHLIKTNLHYPETFTHPFGQER